MLKTFLSKAHSPYQAVKHAAQELEAAGFLRTSLADIENLSAGDYYVRVYETALFAFRIPREHAGRVRIATAHTDFPCFKLKPVPDMPQAAGCRRINVEPYGGMLKRTWFDRPLGIAGAVWVRSDDPFDPEIRLIDIGRPLCMIPSLAPHMDREIESKKIEPQSELVPVWSLGASSDEHEVMDMIAEHAGCAAEDILSFDLNLFDCSEHVMVGDKSQFIMSQGLDNIASVATLVQTFASNEASDDHVSMICLFDNEEIGSRTKQGGDSLMLKMFLDKLGIDYEKSFLVSVDGAHAVHPNYQQKADPTSVAMLGKGITVKTSASERYATDGKMIAMIRSLCDAHDIPYQIQANRSGAPGGSTLGPVVCAYVPVPAADVGIPMLAMHSICETAAFSDIECLYEFLRLVI